MRLAGFLLLLAGWAIVLTAMALLAQAVARGGFVLAGVGVEAVGLVIVVRTYIARRGHRG